MCFTRKKVLVFVLFVLFVFSVLSFFRFFRSFVLHVSIMFQSFNPLHTVRVDLLKFWRVSSIFFPTFFFPDDPTPPVVLI
jgi:hypothetical protein